MPEFNLAIITASKWWADAVRRSPRADFYAKEISTFEDNLRVYFQHEIDTCGECSVSLYEVLTLSEINEIGELLGGDYLPKTRMDVGKDKVTITFDGFGSHILWATSVQQRELNE